MEEVMDVDGVSLVMELDEAYRGFGDREVSGFLSWCLEDEEDVISFDTWQFYYNSYTIFIISRNWIFRIFRYLSKVTSPFEN